ncbi:endonuclease/exonuclease/phosphatase family protein [Lutimonas zeaxanthinifaciens]|uniref:endonuclease/exonuclease/phosphatase family protein n=1 Tax=Lutimonas zeaxanthinifaciens TaxID=3060215 RepID=UPI00265CC941|nr:endonuclease/exonuclease/phosphatase family protein [Lutimonas sp. YSD2104]WKK65958.1 endonuclease/exonuclease/phosphatase family protein [Lutimonas sp. YSD2104]
MRKRNILVFIWTWLLISFNNYGQIENSNNEIIAFYNVENLFDTIDDPDTFDEDYTLEGRYKYSRENYREKIDKTARVISEIGSSETKNKPVLVGLAEIENSRVLNDLLESDKFENNKYEIIHKDSPDHRGIDVALIYKPLNFFPIHYEFLELKLWNEQGERIYTRDVLYVHGILDSEEIHLFVNHWPSRRGGKLKSEPKRLKAAYLVNQKTNEILVQNPKAKILVLGDFNDDPFDQSIKDVLSRNKSTSKKTGPIFFNPMEKMFRKGMNTLAYRDGINLFDQILVSKSFMKNSNLIDGYYFLKAGIYNPAYLINMKGRFAGYPKRSFNRQKYDGGYSDHFPVFIELAKEGGK